PEFDGLVEAGGGDRAAIGAEGHVIEQRLDTRDQAGCAQGPDLAPGGDVPEFDGIVAGGGESAAVRAVDHTSDKQRVLRMSAEGANLPARGRFPYLHDIVTDGGECAAIRAVRHGEDRFLVSAQSAQVELSQAIEIVPLEAS